MAAQSSRGSAQAKTRGSAQASPGVCPELHEPTEAEPGGSEPPENFPIKSPPEPGTQAPLLTCPGCCTAPESREAAARAPHGPRTETWGPRSPELQSQRPWL